MQKELLEQLRKITDEEKRILNGEAEVDKDLYTSGNDFTVALRAVTTTDFMTAEFAEIPWEIIGKTTSRIVNEVKNVNRVLYDCTGKPPATIEFE